MYIADVTSFIFGTIPIRYDVCMGASTGLPVHVH